MPTILGLLQSQWFKDVSRAKRILERYEHDEVDGREKFIRDFLFFGCLTGRRLRTTFGEELCKEITWEEASRTIDDRPAASTTYNLEHVRCVLAKHKPGLVITFGKQATEVMKVIINPNAMILNCVHPAGRGSGVIKRLKEIAEMVQIWKKSH
jgi:hypothetical protein